MFCALMRDAPLLRGRIAEAVLGGRMERQVDAYTDDDFTS